MNPYESPPCGSPEDPVQSVPVWTEPLAKDDAFRRFVLLAIGAASSVMLLLVSFMLSYGLLLIAASVRGQGRFAGRMAITLIIAGFLILGAILFGVIGSLGIRTSTLRYNLEAQPRDH